MRLPEKFYRINWLPSGVFSEMQTAIKAANIVSLGVPQRMPGFINLRCLLHVTTCFLMSLFISPSWMLILLRGKHAD